MQKHATLRILKGLWNKRNASGNDCLQNQLIFKENTAQYEPKFTL